TFVAGDNGSHTFANGVTLTTAGSQTITVNDTVLTTKTGSANVSVSPAGRAQDRRAGPATATAGTPFQVTVTARDSFNNQITGYTGTVHFTAGGAGATLPANYTFVAGDNGSHTFANGVTLTTAGSQTITVNDTVLTTKTGSANVSVSPAGLDHFDLTAPATATAGTPFSVTVTARDSFKNQDNASDLPSHVTGVGARATLPANYTFVAGDHGSHTFTLFPYTTLFRSQTITVNDTVLTTKTGSANVSVSPAGLDHFDLTAPATATAGTPFSVTVTARDSF